MLPGRCLKLSIRIKTHVTCAIPSLIAVHLSTNPPNSSQYSNESYDSFNDLLQVTRSASLQRDMIIILGDFNAQVGMKHRHEKSVIGHMALECIMGMARG